MSWDWLPATRADLQILWSYVLGQTEHITMMGERTMALVDDLVARLSAATDELASDLEALRQEVAGLDENVAAKFEPLVSRLEAMGRDPENPVPGTEGEAADATEAVQAPGGGTEVTNPTPGAQDNPNA